jgi:hypothetical protein
VTNTATDDQASAKKGAPQGDLLQLRGISIINWSVLFLVGGTLLLISHYAIIFFMLGMSPAIVAGITDKRIGNCASRTIGAFNFMGILPSVFELFKAADKAERARQIATDPQMWIFVFVAAGLGWAMIWMIPQITVAIFSIRAEMRIRRLEISQKRLVDEWGGEVSEGTRDFRANTKNHLDEDDLEVETL